MTDFKNLRIKSAIKSRNKFDLPFTHITTSDIGQIVPLYHRPLLPGDEFNVPIKVFARLDPMPCPTYGKLLFRMLHGFVPYYQVADDADAFMAGSTMFQGDVPLLRHFTLGDYMSLLTDTDYSSTVASTAHPDFMCYNASGVATYYKFNDAGRYLYKILASLGYKIPQNFSFQTSSLSYTTYFTKKINAMPLLCFAKLYNDYMSQSQRYNTSQLTEFLHCVRFNRTVSGYSTSTGAINKSGLMKIFDNIYLQYENDYFTSAWQNANNPINTISTVSGISAPRTDIIISNDSITQGLSDTYLAQGNANLITQRGLDFLRSFSDWVRRNNYAGSQPVQQIFARFGIKSEDYRNNYAHVIKTSSAPVQIGDVTATAEGTNVPLGDYAGKGILSCNDEYSYKSSDFGMLLSLGWFTVIPMMSYGFEAETLKTSPLDFYNPEFDGLGAQAISFGEVFANALPDALDLTLDVGTFGFTERYNDYRYSRDVISGDFLNYDSSVPENAWHTGRFLGTLRKNNQMVAQSSAMNHLSPFDSEYNRIFATYNVGYDHFKMVCQCDVTAIRPMLSLNQVPNLGEGDLVVPRNGNTIN